MRETLIVNQGDIILLLLLLNATVSRVPYLLQRISKLYILPTYVHIIQPQRNFPHQQSIYKYYINYNHHICRSQLPRLRHITSIGLFLFLFYILSLYSMPDQQKKNNPSPRKDYLRSPKGKRKNKHVNYSQLPRYPRR